VTRNWILDILIIIGLITVVMFVAHKFVLKGNM
jgi:hypothetical protein